MTPIEAAADQPQPESFFHFDLEAEISKAEDHKPWKNGLRSSVLVKTVDLRVVMIAMEPEAKLEEHHAEGSITVHVLCGSIRMHVQGNWLTLEAGQLLSVQPRIPHDVEALEESVFLLTMAFHGAS